MILQKILTRLECKILELCFLRLLCFLLGDDFANTGLTLELIIHVTHNKIIEKKDRKQKKENLSRKNGREIRPVAWAKLWCDGGDLYAL